MASFGSLTDFSAACLLVAEAGLTVEEATFDGKHFGYWHIKFHRKGLRPHLILWDARDGWLLLQALDERRNAWIDEEVVREPQNDAVQRIIEHLRA